MKSFRYFIFSAAVIIADQITKILVVKHIELYQVAWNFGGDFFRLIHVRNNGAAFSLGSGLSGIFRTILFIVIPLIVIAAVAFYTVKGKNTSVAQRWAMAGVVGGGLGNLIDRTFRSGGVIDFLDVKFYGIFGMERWPTFNLADSVIVVSALTLLVLCFIDEIRSRKQ